MFGRRLLLPATLAVSVTLMASPIVAIADEIKLKDGRVLDGRIISEDAATVTIELKFGPMTIERDRIEAITRGATDLEVYADRLGKLAPTDLEGHAELARWCEEQSLEREALKTWKLVLALDAEHEEAKEKVAAADRPLSASKEAARVAEEAIRSKLNEIPLHLDFSRAKIEDVLTAFSRATDMGVKLESEARRNFAKRKVKMTYQCTDRPADMVLDDICKFSGLDYILKPDKVVLSTPGRIRKMRRDEGLAPSPRRLTKDDVEKILASKTVDITIRDQPLRSLIAHVEGESGLPVVVGTGVDVMQKMSYRGRSQTLAEFMNESLATIGLGYAIQGGTIYITEAAKAKKQR